MERNVFFYLYGADRSLSSLSNPGTITGKGVSHIAASFSCFSQTARFYAPAGAVTFLESAGHAIQWHFPGHPVQFMHY